MTHRKITVCAFVKCSSPKAHEKKQHDWRPHMCRQLNCFGVLVDCEHKIERHMHDREEIAEMIKYLQKIKKDRNQDKKE
ncbi:MAG: hypothetical protein NTY68_02730 [Candidatus Micrarchaeota archaeon]|nr:hypothetical protein [Candidatus Micrarchaeota archaeon]